MDEDNVLVEKGMQITWKFNDSKAPVLVEAFSLYKDLIPAYEIFSHAILNFKSLDQFF